MEKPESTEAMAALDAFLNKTRSETAFDLRDKMTLVKANMYFLLAHADVIPEDMKLVATTLVRAAAAA